MIMSCMSCNLEQMLAWLLRVMLDKRGSTFTNLLDIIPLHLTSIILAVLDPHVFVVAQDEQKHEKLRVLLPQNPPLLQLKKLSKQMFLQILLTQL